MLRQTESQALSAATFWLIASFLVILVFDKNIAILALLFLAFGDGFAAIVGKHYGKTPLAGGKTVEGTLAFAITCLFIAFFFTDLPFEIRVAGVISAAIAELLPMVTSDNLRIPIISGSIMQLMVLLYRGPGLEGFESILV